MFIDWKSGREDARDRLGVLMGTLGYAACVGDVSGANTAEDGGPMVLVGPPAIERGRRLIRRAVEELVSYADDGAVGLPLPPRSLVDAEHARGRRRGVCRRADVREDRGRAGAQPDGRGESRLGRAAQREADHLECGHDAAGAPRVGRGAASGSGSAKMRRRQAGASQKNRQTVATSRTCAPRQGRSASVRGSDCERGAPGRHTLGTAPTRAGPRR